MNIALTPDTYTPSVDNNGNYIDKIPTIRNGLYCPCAARKDKIYENKSNFCTHIKSKTHQRWLIDLNDNKSNYYVEMLKCKELVEQQQKILTQLENQITAKLLTIDYLTNQLTNKVTNINQVNDLIDLN